MDDQDLSDMIVDKAVEVIRDAFAVFSIKANVAKAGKLQADPTKTPVVILVHIGDPEKPDDWKDGWLGMRDKAPNRFDFEAPASQIGGGDLWYRRFTAEVQYWGLKDKPDRDEARRRAALAAGRVKHALHNNSQLAGMKDVFGETTGVCQVVHQILAEGGGPPSSFIWKGKVLFQVMTELP